MHHRIKLINYYYKKTRDTRVRQFYSSKNRIIISNKYQNKH